MGRDRFRRRLVLTAAAASLGIGATLLVADPVRADPIEDQRARVQELTDELERLEQAADTLAEDHVDAIAEQERLQVEVAAAAQQVADREAEVGALRGELSQVAVRAFMGASTDGLGPMLADSSAFTDELQRDQLSRIALSAGDATDRRARPGRRGPPGPAGRVEEAEDQAEAAADEVAATQEATEAQQAEYQQARTDAEGELGRLVQEEEERRARETYERMQREAEAAAAEAAEAQRAADASAQQQAQAAAPDDDDNAAAASSSNSGGGGGGGNAGGGGGGGGTQSAASAPYIPPASSRAGTAVNAALSQLGVPYVGYESIPGVGFDCSGLTMWAWAQAGVSLPHQSRSQQGSVPNVPIEAAQPGDLIFYYSPISHVGIYLGGGQLVHAPSTGDVVKVGTVNWGKVTAVGRPG